MSGVDTVLRAECEQQLNIAAATERVQDRQICLLQAKRESIDAQLAMAMAKRDRAICDRQTALDQL